MDQDKYIALLYKKQQGNLDAMEKILLDKWLTATEINQALAAKIEEEWQLTANYEPSLEYNIDQEYTLLQERIAIDEKPAKVVAMKPARRWFTWAASAAIILLGMGAWLFINQNDSSDVLVQSIYANKLEEIVLVDGTKVWLKANSHFQYPETFYETRTVQLEGEAFFKVTENLSKPFIVETKEANIQVLGTAFNVRAMPDAVLTEVIVKEGKVQLSDRNKTDRVQLAANERGELQHASNEISKTQEEDMNELAWQTQVLYFKRTPLSEVINSLERLFDKDLTVTTVAINNCEFSSRYWQPELDQILNDISREFELTFSSTAEKVITIEGTGCE